MVLVNCFSLPKIPKFFNMNFSFGHAILNKGGILYIYVCEVNILNVMHGIRNKNKNMC